MKELEKNLRECVEANLRRVYGDDSWKAGIPDDVTKSAEKSKSGTEKPWPWFNREDLPLIHYVNFTDYEKIILRRDNWQATFKEVFKDDVIIQAKLRELEPIRNDVAHNRDLSPSQAEILKLYSRHILVCVDAAKRKAVATVIQQ